MNYIEKLLAEYCQDGVEFLELGEIFDLRNGYTPSKNNASFWENGTVPWFRMEDIRTNGRVLNRSIQYVNQSAVKGSQLFPANSIIVTTSATIGEHALVTIPHLTNQRFTCLSVKPELRERFNRKFLFYYSFLLCKWCCGNTNASSFASVDMHGFRKFKFPIPPLAIQNEIVKMLDKFVELQAELQAELQKRKIQYHYYRNAGSRKPEAGSRKPEAGSRKPEAGSRKPMIMLFSLGCNNYWISIVPKAWSLRN